MAIVDLSSLREGTSVGYRSGPIPFTQIDESSIQYNRFRVFGTGNVAYRGRLERFSIALNGKFSFRDEDRFLNSTIQSIGFSTENLGSISLRKLKLKVSDTQRSPSRFTRKLLSGDDKIIGTKFDDKLRGLDGDDEIRGRGGDDIIDGGRGKNKLWGGKGNDIFVVSKEGFSKIMDFTKGNDAIRLDFNAGSLRVENKRGDAFVYSKNTLVSRVNGLANDLKLEGKFLV